MPPALEILAKKLVASGKLRINADYERNFILYNGQTYTTRELTDPQLRVVTLSRIARHVPGGYGQQGIEHRLEILIRELKKARGIEMAKELRIARVLVQAAHPAVIQLLIESGAEVFVSYSHTVADLLPVHEWHNLGNSGGLQATEGEGAAVYVSAAGDPFFEGEQKTYITDGFQALARMVVIAGQELGHFADLKRYQGKIIGRYSTDLHSNLLRADPTARLAWERDKAVVRGLRGSFEGCGLAFLRNIEVKLWFYHQKRRFSVLWLYYQLLRFIALTVFKFKVSKKKLYIKFRTIPRLMTGEMIDTYLQDMAFNLTPDADAYKNDDPLIEEAILVIEAVARVPQQVNKWGHEAVMKAWPNLYQFYYGIVINSCIEQLYQPLIETGLSWPSRLQIFLRRTLRARPGYYP